MEIIQDFIRVAIVVSIVAYAVMCGNGRSLELSAPDAQTQRTVYDAGVPVLSERQH